MEIAQLSRNKYEMLNIARTISGLHVSKDLSVETAQNILQAGGQHIIVKPSNDTEGRMCNIFSDLQQFSNFIEQHNRLDTNWLIQVFISGEEYSVNAIVTLQGIQVYEPIWKSCNSVSQWTHPANRLRQVPHMVTPRALIASMVMLTSKYLAQIPANGLVELEYIVDHNANIWFVELNPRLAATTRMVSLASEKSIFSQLTLAATGHDLSNELVAHQGYCCEFKLPDIGLSNFDTSDFSFPSFSFSTRATVWGETPSQLDANLKRLRTRVKILEQ